jgi:hypothetical protein
VSSVVHLAARRAVQAARQQCLDTRGRVRADARALLLGQGLLLVEELVVQVQCPQVHRQGRCQGCLQACLVVLLARQQDVDQCCDRDEVADAVRELDRQQERGKARVQVEVAAAPDGLGQCRYRLV